MQVSETQNKAAGEIVDLVASRVGANRAVHPETAIASAAQLSGSLLFRSFNLKIDGVEPGTAVLSQEANEYGPQLMSVLSVVLQGLGVSLDQKKVGAAGRGEEQLLTVSQSLELLQDDAMRIARNNGLELQEAAIAGAVATAFIVKECSDDIGSEVGFNVAAFGFIEGCKTVPPAVPSAKSSKPSNPWWRFW